MKTYKSTIDKISLKREHSEIKKAKITTSKDAADYIREFFFDDISIFESFFILLVNNANITIGYAKISQGGTAGTTIDIKILTKICLDGLASGVILAHNHPSGNPIPSQNDKDTTRKIKEALDLFNITIVDHIIICIDDYYSFTDNGILI